jgi:foldase protein PrsA
MRRLFLFASVLLALTGCGELFDPAAAVVNGEKITVAEVEEDLELFTASPEFERLSQQQEAGPLTRSVEQQILSEKIRVAVLQPEAAERDITITDEDVAARIEEIKADFPNEGAFDETLKEQGLTLPRLEEIVRLNLLEERLRAEVTADVGADDDELRAFYDANIDRYRETRAQHILVEDGKRAATIVQQLRAAPASQVDDLFARLAKRFSTDRSNADAAGDLGYFRPGDFVEDFEKAADQLKEGEISNPVRTEFGFHIIRVNDRRIAAFEDVQEQISEELGAGAADRAWNDFLQDAFRAADVKVNPRYGEFDLGSLQVINADARQVPGVEAPTPTASPAASPAG